MHCKNPLAVVPAALGKRKNEITVAKTFAWDRELKFKCKVNITEYQLSNFSHFMWYCLLQQSGTLLQKLHVVVSAIKNSCCVVDSASQLDEGL